MNPKLVYENWEHLFQSVRISLFFLKNVEWKLKNMAGKYRCGAIDVSTVSLEWVKFSSNFESVDESDGLMLSCVLTLVRYLRIFSLVSFVWNVEDSVHFSIEIKLTNFIRISIEEKTMAIDATDEIEECLGRHIYIYSAKNIMSNWKRSYQFLFENSFFFGYVSKFLPVFGLYWHVIFFFFINAKIAYFPFVKFVNASNISLSA